MERDVIRRKIQEIVVNQAGVAEDDVNPESTVDTLGLDSLEVVEILLAVEEEFDLAERDEGFEKLKTVDDLVSYVKAKTKL